MEPVHIESGVLHALSFDGIVLDYFAGVASALGVELVEDDFTFLGDAEAVLLGQVLYGLPAYWKAELRWCLEEVMIVDVLSIQDGVLRISISLSGYISVCIPNVI